MIDLSQKAAKRFRIKWSDLQVRSADHWKIDVVTLEGRPLLLIAHEITLYSLVRTKTEFRSPLDLVPEIWTHCPWYPKNIPVSVGKNGNRHVTGSINEMKQMMMFRTFPAGGISTIEKILNDGLYSYLSPKKHDYGRPLDAVDSYVRGEMPWL